MIDKIEFYEMFLGFELLKKDNDLYFSKYRDYMVNMIKNYYDEYSKLIEIIPITNNNNDNITYTTSSGINDELVLWLKNKIRELKIEKIIESI